MDSHTTGTKATATGTIAANFGNYIDSTDGNLYILTMGETYCGTDANVLLYYEEVVITYSAAPPVSIPQSPDVNWIAPAAPNWYSGNQLVDLDLNFGDIDNNTLKIDINYLLNDKNYSLLDDLNSVDYCDSNNFFLPQECTFEVTNPDIDGNIQFIIYVIDDDLNFDIAYAPYEFGIRSQKGKYRINADVNFQGSISVEPYRNTLADAWNVRSFSYLKKDITPIDNKLPYSELFDTLNYYSYTMKDDNKMLIGLLAEETPELLLSDSNGINLYELIILQSLAFQEYKEITDAKIESLEQRITTLEKQISTFLQFIGIVYPPIYILEELF